MESRPRPPLSLKVAYFLSDTSMEGRGNFWVIPGSHLHDTIQRPTARAAGSGYPGDGQAGHGRILRPTWHTATHSWSGVTRKILFFGYG
jgi:ectoine hydroxylase